MSTIKLEIDDSKLNIVLNIIHNLKEGLIAKYEVVDSNRELKDDHETKAFSEHTANLIDDWYDASEDSVWK